MRTTIAILLGALTMAAGCGADERPVDRAAGGAPRGAGAIEVRMSIARGPIYYEGSVPRIRIEREDGSVVLEGDFPVDSLDRPVLRRRLPAGTYRFESVQLPCQGTCGLLDDPDADTRCSIAFTVADKSRQVLEIVLDRVRDAGATASCAARPA